MFLKSDFYIYIMKPIANKNSITLFINQITLILGDLGYVN